MTLAKALRLRPHLDGKLAAREEARLLARPIRQEYDAFKVAELTWIAARVSVQWPLCLCSDLTSDCVVGFLRCCFFIPSRVVSPQSPAPFRRARVLDAKEEHKQDDFPSPRLKKSRGLGRAPRSTGGTASKQRKSQIYNFCDSAIANY